MNASVPPGTDRARTGAVQPDLDGSRAELRPLLAGAIAQLELQHVAVERDRAIHVAHEEVDEVRVPSIYPAPRSTAAAADELGTPRHDCTTPIRPSPARSCSTQARNRARPFASWR